MCHRQKLLIHLCYTKYCSFGVLLVENFSSNCDAERENEAVEDARYRNEHYPTTYGKAPRHLNDLVRSCEGQGDGDKVRRVGCGPGSGSQGR